MLGVGSIRVPDGDRGQKETTFFVASAEERNAPDEKIDEEKATKKDTAGDRGNRRGRGR